MITRWYTQSIKQLTEDLPVYELYELSVYLSVCALGPWASTTCLFSCLLDGPFVRKPLAIGKTAGLVI
jgi:hypothetical protein